MDYCGNFLYDSTNSFESEILYDSSNFLDKYPVSAGNGNMLSIINGEAGTVQELEPVRQRYHANARERDRTQNVNTAFAILRSLIPTEPHDRKLSKIEVLRLAESYINHLANQLTSDNNDLPCIEAKRLLISKVAESSNSKNQVCTFCWSMMKKEAQKYKTQGSLK